MKLKPCKACENQVSPSAKACPKCGQPLKEGGAVFKVIGAVSMAVGVVAVLSFGAHNSPAVAVIGAVFAFAGFALAIAGRALD